MTMNVTRKFEVVSAYGKAGVVECYEEPAGRFYIVREVTDVNGAVYLPNTRIGTDVNSDDPGAVEEAIRIAIRDAVSGGSKPSTPQG
jgi:hypothetical protein